MMNDMLIKMGTSRVPSVSLGRFGLKREVDFQMSVDLREKQ